MPTVCLTHLNSNSICQRSLWMAALIEAGTSRWLGSITSFVAVAYAAQKRSRVYLALGDHCIAGRVSVMVQQQVQFHCTFGVRKWAQSKTAVPRQCHTPRPHLPTLFRTPPLPAAA